MAVLKKVLIDEKLSLLFEVVVVIWITVNLKFHSSFNKKKWLQNTNGVFINRNKNKYKYLES